VKNYFSKIIRRSLPRLISKFFVIMEIDKQPGFCQKPDCLFSGYLFILTQKKYLE